MIHNLKWSFISQVGCSTLSIGFTILVMNIVAPEDYGLLGMVLPLYIFLGMIANFAQDRSIIAAKKVDDETLSTLWWAKFLWTTGIAILFVLCTPLIISFYNEPRLNLIIYWLATTLVFQSFLEIHKSILYRSFSFKVLTIIEVSTIALSGILTYGLALKGWAFKALIAKEVLNVTLALVMMLLASKWLPKFFFSFKNLKEHFHFGKNVTIARFMNFFSRNLDDILVGKKFGGNSLGIYSKSYSLLTLPLTLISKSFVTAVLPSMPHLRADPFKANEIYLKAVRSILVLNTPLCTILYFGAESIVQLLLPESWTETIPLIRLFCLLSAFQALGPLNDLIYEGMSHTDKIVKYTGIGHLITISGIIIGYLFGADVFELALFYVSGNFITFFTNQYFIHRMTGVAYRNLLVNLLPYYVLAMMSAIPLMIVLKLLPTIGPFFHLILVVIMGLTFYYAPMTILFPKQFSEFKVSLHRLLRSFKK